MEYDFENIWDNIDDNSTAAGSTAPDSNVNSDLSDDDEEEFDPYNIAMKQYQGNLLKNVGRGKAFPIWAYHDILPQQVSQIPFDIDGMKMYKIKTDEDNWLRVTTDRRYFNMLSSNRNGFEGYVKIGTCMGAWVCTNPICTFRSTSHGQQANKVSFRVIKGKKHVKECLLCSGIAEQEGCGAKKYVEYNTITEIVTVYHLGNHTCTHLKIDKSPTEEYLTKRAQEKYVGKSAKEMGVDEIISYIDQGKMEEATQVAGHWVDRRMAKWVLEKEHPTRLQDNNSFDAVGIVKRAVDKKDPFYIYRVRNKNYGNSSDFVFKTSQKMAEIAIQMDKTNTEDTLLKTCNAYFDATHTRVHGFKSLGLWFLHPTMAEMQRLASMEIQTETHTDIALFFRLFNEVLAKVKDEKGYKFNPCYFCCDEGGANFKAIVEVYGEEFARNFVKGCKWHFQRDVHSHLGKITEAEDKKFKKIMKKLCEVTTVANYDKHYRRLMEMGKKYPDLVPFIDGVDRKKFRMFDPFRGGGLPGVNLSEAGNRTFKLSGTMRLVHAAKYDVATMILQEKGIEMSARNMMKVRSHAPTQAVRDKCDRDQQMRIGEEFANLLDNEEDILLEAQAAEGEHSYNPRGVRHPHLARGMRNSTKPVNRGKGGRGRGRGKGRGKPAAPPPTPEEMEAKCREAVEIIDAQLQPSGRSSLMNNPPLVVKAYWQITKCRGCKKSITTEDKEYPHDLVFQRRGICGYFNTVQNKWVENEAFVYYHLSIQCLRKGESTLEYRYISAVDDVFATLDREQMVVLNDLGFLRPIVEKKL